MQVQQYLFFYDRHVYFYETPTMSESEDMEKDRVEDIRQMKDI